MSQERLCNEQKTYWFHSRGKLSSFFVSDKNWVYLGTISNEGALAHSFILATKALSAATVSVIFPKGQNDFSAKLGTS